MMQTRREAVLGGLLTIAMSGSCGCTAPAAHLPATVGCFLTPSFAKRLLDKQAASFPTGSEPIIPGSGDKAFDFALAQTLSRMSDTLQVLPSFAFYDDSAGMNAYASPLRRLSNSDGTVLLGTSLLKSVLSERENPDAVVAAICAHEFGHIVQFKNDLLHVIGGGQKTVKRLELHADLLAGFYAGTRKLQRRDYPAVAFALRAYRVGDYDRNHRNHHGTPEERSAAVIRGFEFAYHERRTLTDAIQAGLTYVSKL